MRFNLISAVLAALCFALPTTAQKVQVFGGNGQRAASTMILFGQDIMAGLKNVVGGELTGYTDLLQEARGEAIRRMSYQAEGMGANAIVNVRFATSSVAQGAAELFAYGTAVRVE